MQVPELNNSDLDAIFLLFIVSTVSIDDRFTKARMHFGQTTNRITFFVKLYLILNEFLVIISNLPVKFSLFSNFLTQ